MQMRCGARDTSVAFITVRRDYRTADMRNSSKLQRMRKRGFAPDANTKLWRAKGRARGNRDICHAALMRRARD